MHGKSDAEATLEAGLDGLGLLDAGVRRDVVGDPDVAADDGVVADGDASEDGGVGVDGDEVLDDGVAGHVEHVALGIVLEALGTEGDALVEGHVGADDAGLADDDARAVVDGEVLADGGTGVDVDAGLGVGLLGDDARYDGHLQLVQGVCQSVVGHGVDDGIAVDDLAVVGGGGVVVEHGLDVGIEESLDLGQLLDELQGNLLGSALDVALGALLAELEGAGHLSAEQVVELLHVDADDVGAHLRVGLALVEVVREDDALDEFDDAADVDDGGQRGLRGRHHAQFVLCMLCQRLDVTL